jgi:hypothetical protein
MVRSVDCQISRVPNSLASQSRLSALTNVAKYASATSAEVTIQEINGDL